MAQQRGGGPPSGMQAGAGGGRPPGMQAPPGGLKALRRALLYLRHYWRDSLGALLALLLVSAANLTTPQLIRSAIDQGVAKHHSDAIVSAVIGIVGLAVVRGLFTFLQGFLAERASQGVARRAWPSTCATPCSPSCNV